MSDPTIYELLKYCPLKIMQCWKFEDFQHDALICHQGNECQTFSIIVSGEVDIFYETKDGRRYQQAHYHKGSMLGELEIFESRNYICSVTAASNVMLLSLSQEHFNHWLKLDNHFNQQVLRFFSHQYYQLSRKASNDRLYSLHQRVCLALWQRHQQCKSTTFCLDKQNLSQELAATTRSINRILRDLKVRNIIETNSELIILLLPEKLKQEVENATPYSA